MKPLSWKMFFLYGLQLNCIHLPFVFPFKTTVESDILEIAEIRWRLHNNAACSIYVVY